MTSEFLIVAPTASSFIVVERSPGIAVASKQAKSKISRKKGTPLVSMEHIVALGAEQAGAGPTSDPVPAEPWLVSGVGWFLHFLSTISRNYAWRTWGGTLSVWSVNIALKTQSSNWLMLHSPPSRQAP